jgi:hypothetical protein
MGMFRLRKHGYSFGSCFPHDIGSSAFGLYIVSIFGIPYYEPFFTKHASGCDQDAGTTMVTHDIAPPSTHVSLVQHTTLALVTRFATRFRTDYNTRFWRDTAAYSFWLELMFGIQAALNSVLTLILQPTTAFRIMSGMIVG